MDLQVNAGTPPVMGATDAVKMGVFRRLAARVWTRALSHPSLIRLVAGTFPCTRRPAADPGPFDASAVRSILVARTDGIGDMILTLPLLVELRRFFPAAKITLATSGTNAALLNGADLVDEVIDMGRRTPGVWGRALRWMRWSKLCKKVSSQGPPDLAIFPRWGMDLDYVSAVGYLSGARWRLGYSEHVEASKADVQSGYDTLLTHIHRSSCDHEAYTNLNILKGLGLQPELRKASLGLDEGEREQARQWLKDRGLEAAPTLIALGIGANEQKRRWPVEAYAQVVKALSAEMEAKFIVIGGPQENEDARHLCDQFPSVCHDATNGVPLRASAALLERCCLYIGNNSGPMHLAALMGLPVVYASCHSLTGSDTDSNSDFRFAPSQVPYTCIRPARPLPGCVGDCDSKEPHCICQVSPDEVLQASRGALAGHFEANAQPST